MPELICALGPDNAGTIITGLMRRARASLDVAMYEIGPSYAWALAAAAKRGVRVRVVLDGHPTDGNAGTAAAVRASGGSCRVLDRTHAAGHWKLLVLDGRQVATGTGNLVWRDAPRDARGRLPPAAPPLRGTREWWVVTDDADAATSGLIAFETAWDSSRQPPRAWRGVHHAAAYGAVGAPAPQVEPRLIGADPGAIRLLIGGLSLGVAIRDAIDSAQSRVLITTPYIRSRAPAVRSIFSAARASAIRGADVRLLLGARPASRDAAYLLATGLPARWMDPATWTRGHAKGVVADSTAIVASANWSHPGLGMNWESGLAVASPAAAAYLAAAWDRDWAAAIPVSAAV